MKIRIAIEGSAQPVTVKGRMAWALNELMAAGERGVTTLERPALRRSSYVEKLRRKGIAIDCELERHGGAFPGRHGRYRLRSNVDVIVEPE